MCERRPAVPVNFSDRLETAIRRCRTAAVVGIDPVLERLPPGMQPELSALEDAARAVERFACGVIDAVSGIVPAVKINSAFFEPFYELGVGAYFRCIAYAHRCGLLAIGDVKRGDIGSTSELYARGHLANPAFVDVSEDRIPDAITISGYLGEGGVRPFIRTANETGRGVYILVRPSDPGADYVHEYGGERPFYWHMAELVKHWGAGNGMIGENGLSCVGAVVAPKDAAQTRSLRLNLPNTPFLVPGYGAQGGTAESCAACFRAAGDGAIVNASRSVIYAYADPRYNERFGRDWQACVAAAARNFADDIARIRSGTA